MNAKPRGRFLILFGWVLLGISGIALVGTLQLPRQRDPSIQALLTHPDGFAVAGTIGLIIGSNFLSIFACLFGVYGSVKKNPRAKALILASVTVFLVNSGILFLLSSEEAVESISKDGQSQIDVQEHAQQLYDAIRKISPIKVTRELQDALDGATKIYTSKQDAFSVTMPSVPNVIERRVADIENIRTYQAESQNSTVQYFVHVGVFDTKILSEESIRAYLNRTPIGRLVVANESRIVKNAATTFRGFDAQEYEYTSTYEGIEVINKGITFIIDGDSMSLTMMYPKGVEPKLKFDDFIKTFELLPLEPVLATDYWIDMSSGLRFNPPADMSEKKTEKGRNGLIVTFGNKAGHSMSIFSISAPNPNYTLTDVRRELGGMQQDADGHYKKEFIISGTRIPMVQLMHHVVNNGRIYMIQGCSPKQTYFRSERKFKEAMKTLAFDN
jgi:hypothetical protein